MLERWVPWLRNGMRAMWDTQPAAELTHMKVQNPGRGARR